MKQWNPFDSVGRSSGPPSVGREIFQKFLSKPASADNWNQYLLDNAVQTALNLQDYRPVRYDELPVMARQYCEQRLQHVSRISYSPPDSLRVAAWIQAFTRTALHNHDSIAHLQWARGLLEKAGLSKQVEAVSRAIALLEAQELPAKDAEDALATMKLDAIARANRKD